MTLIEKLETEIKDLRKQYKTHHAEVGRTLGADNAAYLSALGKMDTVTKRRQVAYDKLYRAHLDAGHRTPNYGEEMC